MGPEDRTQNTSALRIEHEERPVVIRRHDAVLAATKRALLVHGQALVPIYYVPREDVYMEHFVEVERPPDMRDPSGRRVFSITASGGGVERAAWIYLDPRGPIEPLKGHVGFEPEPFNVTVG